MSIEKTHPEGFSPADMTRAQLEAIVGKTRVLARLTTDFLHLQGHRIHGAGKGGANPLKAMVTLKALDAHLGEMAGVLGLAAPKAGV